MVAVTYRNHAKAMGRGLFNRQIHRPARRDLSHRLVAVKHRGQLRLINRLRLRIRVYVPLYQAVVVTDHSLDSMRFDSIEIRRQDHIDDPAGLLFRKAMPHKNIFTIAADLVCFQSHICHNCPSRLLLLLLLYTIPGKIDIPV